MDKADIRKFFNRLLFTRVILFAAIIWILYGAAIEFYNVAWGTGNWLGQFSTRWGLAFFGFLVFEILVLFGAAAIQWRSVQDWNFLPELALWRTRGVASRWLAAIIVLIAPIWFLQYSPWGVVFSKPYIRIFIWGLTSLVGGFLVTSDTTKLLNWSTILAALIISGAGFAMASLLSGVTNYPFALDWSEGNRLWDYSLLFGKNLYNYSPQDPPSAYLDFGRQLVGGLPFLLPAVSVLGERLWVAAMGILPYMLLGVLAFRPTAKGSGISWIFAGIWAFMFLNQGPIHVPLIFCAILVAIAWGQTLWLGMLLIAVSGYFAELSRFTWMFAPAMWAVQLELGGSIADGERIAGKFWKRAILFCGAGLLGSGISIVQGQASGQAGLSTVTSASTQQPLLWYRLFPNATYGYGILLGLFIASGPLILTMLYLVITRWKPNFLQTLCLALPLLAFLAVGLIVSTKIGGGGDLHNMDMFLIGLMFTAALAWRNGGAVWLARLQESGTWMQAIILLLIVVPAFQPLMGLRPLSFAKDTNWVAVLADVQKPRDLGSLPSDEAIASDLVKLRTDVHAAQAEGEVLFMDQRQLLTFDNIKNVRLVSEYEKKRMMDEALSGNEAYFQPFYADLASHRFSLIISDPLRTPIKDSDYGFGEENNAWVKWIAKPVLCYYEEKDTLTDVRVELLVPHQGSTDCSAVLP